MSAILPLRLQEVSYAAGGRSIIERVSLPVRRTVFCSGRRNSAAIFTPGPEPERRRA